LNKQGIYITLVNAFIGIVASILLKDNAVVALILVTLIIGTVLFIERAWLNQFLFRNRRRYALAAYSVLAIGFIFGLVIATGPMRKTSAIIASTTAYLDCIKAGDAKGAYGLMSAESRQSYPLADFIGDHADNRVRIQDFTIEQVTVNKFNSNKAQATVSSPFGIYGHETLNMELAREEGVWRIVFSRNIVTTGNPGSSPKARKSGGKITDLLKSLF
jgi:hypothetical protein